MIAKSMNLVVAAFAAFALALSALLLSACSGTDQKGGADEVKYVEVEATGFKLVYPATWNEVVNIQLNDDGSLSLYNLAGSVRVADIFLAGTQFYEDETLYQRYNLGTAVIDGLSNSVVLQDELLLDGRNAHWSQTQANTSAIEEFLGITVPDFAAYVRLQDGDRYVAAQLSEGTHLVTDYAEVHGGGVLQGGWAGMSGGAAEGSAAGSAGTSGASGAAGVMGSSSGSAVSGSSGNASSIGVVNISQPALVSSELVKPFYGVWIAASKDIDEILGYADDARAKGFDTIRIVWTTDWSNLNTEPWYVLSLGTFANEDQANAMLSRAQNAGYSNAYVKYSGNFQG